MLADSQMFVAQISVKLKNTNGAFSTDNVQGIFGGETAYGQVVDVFFDGANIFSGILRNVTESYGSGTVTFLIENILTKVAETTVVLTTASANPVSAVLGQLQAFLPASRIDVSSFSTLATEYSSAGATIGCAFTESNKTTLLQFIQDVSSLAGFSVFTENGLVTCRPGISRSPMGQTLTGNVVRPFGDKGLAFENFANRVKVGYGAAQVYVQEDLDSIHRHTNETKDYSFTTDNTNSLYVTDLISAQYFATIFLARCGNIRTQITLDVDDEGISDVSLGDVFGITAPDWYLEDVPFEVLEVHRIPKDFVISLVMASKPTAA